MHCRSEFWRGFDFRCLEFQYCVDGIYQDTDQLRVLLPLSFHHHDASSDMEVCGGPATSSAQKVLDLGKKGFRCLFGDVVSAVQLAARDICGNLSPFMQRIEQTTDDPMSPP